MKKADAVTRFYLDQLPGAKLKNNILQTSCPFCPPGPEQTPGSLVVFLNPESYFHGYFRCLSRCAPGGFPLHFARCKGVGMNLVPGYDPDREPGTAGIDYPVKNINTDIQNFRDRMTDELLARFHRQGIAREVLEEMQVGYNGRYLVYPYIEEDGNCYTAHCIHPDRPEDTFWYGNEQFPAERTMIFNGNDIDCCENGALVIVEGEDNLLALKQLGLPGIAVPAATDLEKLDPGRFAWLHTLFLWVNHSADAERAARTLATGLGYKARLIRWPEDTEKKYSLVRFAADRREHFRQDAFMLIKEARAFSPFASPEKELLRFQERLQQESGENHLTMESGFAALDQTLDGIHGINIVGGTPKGGKSCLFIQIATEMACRKIPVIYYDFENGRQKIYQRTLCRLSRLSAERIRADNLNDEEAGRLTTARENLRALLPWFRVVTDRKLTPELMRRHIDFLRHETKSRFTLVVIDSLHKLPFKDFSERRTGIDAWLRQLESIRDEQNVSFLVVSELSRGPDGRYARQPHLGSFKGSGDIEYSADNAMVLLPDWNPFDHGPLDKRINSLWLVASREHNPGKIADYRLDYPFWGFEETRGE
ncbi:MAG: AAA family ATPase [Proteobacteria bacterium]|nr:AAA family ATPase [Pseudomonadota bacterium]